MMIDTRYKTLSSSSVDILMDIVEYARPQTVAGCWAKLDEFLQRDRITKSTYEEIKAAVTFVEEE